MLNVGINQKYNGNKMENTIADFVSPTQWEATISEKGSYFRPFINLHLNIHILTSLSKLFIWPKPIITIFSFQLSSHLKCADLD